MLASVARRGANVWAAPWVRHLSNDVAKQSSRIFTTDEQRRQRIEEALRVDHAGEFGAVRIYDGQLAVLGRTASGPLIEEMRKTEVDHLDKMNELLVDRRVRPTALLPLWDAAGFALGFGTALLGKQAAMACTVAVEEVISEHYNDQIRMLLENGYTDEELKEVLKKNRDEEMDHLNTANSEGASQAPGFQLLTNVIKIGCKGAIWLAKKV